MALQQPPPRNEQPASCRPGIDVYGALPAGWLWANVLFGLAWIPAAWWGSRRLLRWRRGSSLVQRIARGVAGEDLKATREFLDELARFEES